MLGEFGNGASRHAHSTTNNTGQAFADICSRAVFTGPVKADGQAWDDMASDLIINCDQSAIEGFHRA
jgi:hypothetical protein